MSPSCQQLDPYDTLIQKTLDKFIPLKLDWEITHRCNLFCSHCYQDRPKSLNEITTQQAFDALDQLADLGCLYVTFTGGEIFVREDFLDIARYARKKHFAIRLFTNGTLVDEKLADEIASLHPLSVEMSLYGMDPQVHESITKSPESYQKTRTAFDLLKARNVNTVVKCTLMKENIHEFNALEEFAKSIRSSFVYSLTVIPKLDGNKEVLNHRLSQQELSAFLDRTPSTTKDITAGGIHDYKPLCSAGINAIYICPEGEMYPCVALRKSCGNIKEKPIKEILASPFFKTIRTLEFDDLPECKGCSYAHFCDRCPGLALMETGDLYGASPNECTLAKARKKAVEQREEKDGEYKKEKVLQ
jgi:radical SAM protein with 4Fe4S-binding SPASM domain